MNARGRGWWPLGFVLAAVLGLGVVHRTHGPELGADDHGQYLLHARALLEGRPYTEIGFLHSQYSTLVAPVAEPPGLPLLIAASARLGLSPEAGARAILLFAFCAIGLLVFASWRWVVGDWQAAVISAWTLMALSRSHVLDTVMADLPFMACLWAALLLTMRGTPSGGRLAGLLVAGGMAFSFRMAALPLLPAAATMFLLERERRSTWVLLGTGWLAMAGFVMIGLSAGSVLGGESVRGATALWSDVQLNIRAIADGVREGLVITTPSVTGTRVLHLLLLVVALTGLATDRRWRTSRFGVALAVWYVVMLVVLPTRAPRYVWPLLPFVAHGMVCGVAWFAARITAEGAARTSAVVSGMLVMVGAWQVGRISPPRTFREVPDVKNVVATLRAEFSAAPNMRVAFFAPRVLTWETGIRSAPLFGADPDSALAFMRTHGITHVVTGDAGAFAIGRAGMDSIVAARPERFERIQENGSFRTFRLVP